MNSKLLLTQELNKNETLLWQGQPKQGFLVRSSDIVKIPLTFLWFGFVLFWEYNAIMTTDALYFKIFGIPFVIIGFYISIGRFFVDSYQRKHCLYALTNKRAIIITAFNKKIKSIDLKNLSEVNLSLHKNNYGTITFGNNNLDNSFLFFYYPYFSNTTTPKFDYIKNVNQPYRIIKDQLNKSS